MASILPLQKEGEYTLHTRGILELEQYILRHYPDSAHKCHICCSLAIQVRMVQPAFLCNLSSCWGEGGKEIMLLCCLSSGLATGSSPFLF